MDLSRGSFMTLGLVGRAIPSICPRMRPADLAQAFPAYSCASLLTHTPTFLH